MEVTVRQPATAGTFYPSDKKELEDMIAGFFAEVPTFDNPHPPKALIVPHAGYIYSGQVAAYAYARVRGHHYSKIVLLGPSHYVYLRGVVASPHQVWRTPLGDVPTLKNGFEANALAHLNEHCLEVQLPFLQYTLKDFKILPLVIGDSNAYPISNEIRRLLDKDTLLIISSDLSHYHSYPEAEALDKASIKAIKSLDDKSSVEACGKFPIRILVSLAKTLSWKPEVLIYKNSGDVTKDKTRVVGYASLAFYAK